MIYYYTIGYFSGNTYPIIIAFAAYKSCAEIGYKTAIDDLLKPYE